MNQAASMRVLIMAGGTGGHVFPAMAIARYLQAQGVTVEWLGTAQGLESRVVPAASIVLHRVSIVGLRGKSWLRKLLSPFLILRATWQSWRVIRHYQPDCVLGMGGFVTGPGGIAAWLARKPLVIHEQNAIAGFTNLMLMPFAQIVMEAFPGSFVRKRQRDDSLLSRWASRKASEVQRVGNPVRDSIAELAGQVAPPQAKARVLVLGGSLGAAAINRILPQVLARFDEGLRPDLWHQCGDRHQQDCEQAYASAGVPASVSVRIEPFIEDMAAAYGWADIVIARAGALTVAELSAAGKAAILIPYPHGVDDHQTENARFLADQKAALLIPEAALTVERLFTALDELIRDKEKTRRMADNAARLANPQAVTIIGKLCLGARHG